MVRTANCWKSSCQPQSTMRVTRKYQISHPVGGSTLPGSLSWGGGFFMCSLKGVSSSLARSQHEVVAAALLTPYAQEHALAFDLFAQFDGFIGAGDWLPIHF